MKKVRLIFSIFSLLVPLGIEAQRLPFDAHSWGNLVPLKSTRKDVERKFGQPDKAMCMLCVYKIKEGDLTVLYSDAPCASREKGWDVQKDTVLEYSIDLGEGIDVDDELLNKEVRVSTRLDEYLLPTIGVTYKEVLKNKIIKITFGPTTGNNDLRCKGFPPYDPVGSSYIPTSETASLDDAPAFIDRLWVEIENNRNATGYVLVYAPKEMSQTDYDALFVKLEKHLAMRRLTRLGSIKLVKAGRRTEFAMESFVLPKEIKRPVPSPDFPSVEFQ